MTQKNLSKAVTLTPLQEGELLGRNRANALIAMFNAFVNGTVVWEDPAEILFSDKNIIIKIGKRSLGSSGSSSYRGEYEPTGATTFNPGPFVFGDWVRVSPTNSVATPAGSVIPGVYICVQDGPGETDLPKHSLSTGGETVFWHCLSTAPSVRQMCDDSGNSIDVFSDSQDKPT